MLTVARLPIDSTPVRIASSMPSGTRVTLLHNDGPCPVWIGTANLVAGAGRVLWPGDDYTYTELDELYAVARGNPPGSLASSESRAQ